MNLEKEKNEIREEWKNLWNQNKEEFLALAEWWLEDYNESLKNIEKKWSKKYLF